MKQIFIVLALFSALPALATCSLDGLTCSAGGLNYQTENAYITNSKANSTKQNISKANTLTKDLSIQKTNSSKEYKKQIGSKSYRKFNPNSTDYSYNTNCQFGVCYDFGSPQLFNDRFK